MAELIDKGATLVDMNALLEELEDYIEYDTFDHYKEEPLINMSFETLEDVITSQPTTTEAEIRAKAEHTYENCHNITCRRKCQKDGYNMAIDEFAEKVKPIIDEKIKGWTNSDDLRRWCERAINDVAEQLKEE